MQHQMCDIKQEIDRERDLCEAQTEHKTTGMHAENASFVMVERGMQ